MEVEGGLAMVVEAGWQLVVLDALRGGGGLDGLCTKWDLAETPFCSLD